MTCADELLGVRSAAALSRPRAPSTTRAVGQHAGRLDRRARLACHATGRRRRTSRARSRSDPSARGSSRTAGSARCAASASRIDSFCPSATVSATSAGTSGGGGGGGDASRLSSTNLPRSTGDVRVGYDVTVRMLPWPSKPPRALSARQRRRGGSGCRARAECRSARRAARSRTCSSPSADRARCDRCANTLATNSSVSRCERGAQRLRRNRGTGTGPGRCRVDVAQEQPLRREVVDERVGARVCEHARDLARQAARLRQLARGGDVEQLVVRHAAPEEVRQARRELHVADAQTVAPGCAPAGCARCEQELRARRARARARAGSRARSRRSATPAS